MLYRLDVDTFRAIHIGLHHPWLDPFFWALTWLGDGTAQTLMVFAILLSPKFRGFFWPLIISFAVGGLLGAQGLKKLIPRERPSNLPWAHPQELIYGNSFPSGHTTASFALAVMIVLLTRRTRYAWAGWVAILYGCLVGLSRIYRGVHWPSDVVAGAFCGTFFACATYLVLERLGRLPTV
ncbi:MAG: phosphatase PAP2 family protein [Fimbriimonadaceae bacterium]